MTHGPGARIEAIDVLRGWAILLVVVGHAIQWTDAAFDLNPVFRFIYSFHMPLFFFISGIVSNRSMSRPLGALIRTKARSLLLPFVVWWLLTASVNALAGGPGLGRSLVALVRSPDVGLWFLWVLFVATLVATAVLRVLPERLRLVGLVIVSAVLWALPAGVLGLRLVAWYFPFFAAGLMLSGRLAEERAWTRPRPVMAFTTAAAWLALAAGWRRTAQVWLARMWAAAGLPLATAVDIATRYGTAFAGIAASALVVPFAVGSSHLQRGLRFLGVNTLEIYVSHALFLQAFAHKGIGWAPLAAAASLIGSLLLARLLKSFPVTDTLLYGGRGAARAS